MLFNSGVFVVVFLPIVVLGYYGINKLKLNRKKTLPWDLIWLFLSSLIFYGYEKPIYVLLIMISIGANYSLTMLMKHFSQYKKIVLWVGLLFNFGLLFYFKYFNFFMTNMYLLKGEYWIWRNVVLPLGISFFTFQQVSYLIDFYRESEPMNYNFWEYAAFISFFPQLVAGPIVLHKELIPQFRDANTKNVNYDNLSQGLYAFSLGLAKKVLLADTLSKIVSIGFRDVLLINTGTGLVVMLAYTLQIYFDFSGYCDMAIGIAKMFNLVLPINFNSPYKAKTIREFWKRWHITLTRFFTTYVYIPLGGSRKGKIRTYWNTFLIFVLSGLWHGANWTFVLWGILHGVLMVIEKIYVDMTNYFSVKRIKLFEYAYQIVVFSFINITWLIFRASSVKEASIYFRGLFNGIWNLNPMMIDKLSNMLEIRILSRLGFEKISNIYPPFYLVSFLVICYVSVYFLKNTQEKMFEAKYNWKRSIITIGLCVWSIFSLSDVGEFLYFNF